MFTARTGRRMLRASLRAIALITLAALCAGATVSASGASNAQRELPGAEKSQVGVEIGQADGADSTFSVAAAKDFLREPRRVRQAVAERNGLTLKKLDQMLRTDNEITVSNDGELIWHEGLGLEPIGPRQLFGTQVKSQIADPIDLLWPTGETFGLHSNRGATKVIYLDFDGQLSNDPNRLDAPPWDSDANPGSFSQNEHAQIQAVWQEVADDFAAFNVDVTTERPVGFGVVGGITQVLIGHTAAFHAENCNGWCGGISNSWFGAPLVFARSHWEPHMIASVASHELGHVFGLVHDGWLYADGSDEEYYKGHGNWAPVMGSAATKGISHFATGSYAPTPNNDEDDLSIMAASLGGLRTDDHADDGDWANVSPFPAASASMVGVIEDRGDSDGFSYTVPCDGTVEMLASGPMHGPNVDIELSVYSAGDVTTALAVDNPATAVVPEYPATGLSASASTVAETGDELLVAVAGVGAHVEGLDGYSDYGSIGAYSLAANTVCDDPGESAAVLTISSPAVGTTIVGATATVTGTLAGGLGSSVDVAFAEQSGTVDTTTVTPAADGSWTATIPVTAGESYEVTASSTTSLGVTALATTSFTVWSQPTGAPAYLSVAQPPRGAEVDVPVRLAGVFYDNVGLGAPRLTIQDPAGRYWDGTEFLPSPVNLAISVGSHPDVERGWEYIFDPTTVGIANGSYTARLSGGSAVINGSDYTTFEIGEDVTPPQIIRFGKENISSSVVVWDVLDEHGLDSLEVSVVDANGATSTHAVLVAGYEDSASFDVASLGSPGPHAVSATLLDRAGNATASPEIMVGVSTGDHIATVDPVAALVETIVWGITGSTENLGAPAQLRDLAFVEGIVTASTDVGTMQWHPAFGWHPDGGAFTLTGSVQSTTWGLEGESFGSVPHNVLVDVTDVNGRDTMTIGGFGFTQLDVDLKEYLLDLRVHLEGPFNVDTASMNDDLRDTGLVPLLDPYLGTTSTTPAVLGTTGIRAPVDWVLVELHSTAAPSASSVQIPALVLRDGSVVAPDGKNPLLVETDAAEYYVTISHRNHLPATVVVELGPRAHMNIDVGLSTESGLPGFGVHQRCDLGPCRMFAGNGAQDGFGAYMIDGSDKVVWFAANGDSGTYHAADYNLDADISGGDKIPWSANNGLYAPLPPW